MNAGTARVCRSAGRRFARPAAWYPQAVPAKHSPRTSAMLLTESDLAAGLQPWIRQPPRHSTPRPAGCPMWPRATCYWGLPNLVRAIPACRLVLRRGCYLGLLPTEQLPKHVLRPTRTQYAPDQRADRTPDAAKMRDRETPALGA